MALKLIYCECGHVRYEHKRDTDMREWTYCMEKCPCERFKEKI